MTLHHLTAVVDGHEVFYREAGPTDAPTIVLLHGFPTSSFMFRDLVPRLAERYHVIAPDHLGFGFSAAPAVVVFDTAENSSSAVWLAALVVPVVVSAAVTPTAASGMLGWCGGWRGGR